MVKKIIALVFLIVFAGTVRAELKQGDIQLVGLFKDTAVLNINGKPRLVKAGKRSPEGVELIAVSGAEAELRIGDKQFSLALSRAVGARYQERKTTQVVIKSNGQGQYQTPGTINAQPVYFLVDTGATSIAMNSVQARRLGIDLASGIPGQASTAGGIVNSYQVTLDSVKVGDLELRNVRAAVIEGIYPQYVLLGMTYLSRVHMEEDKGILTLTQKY